MNLQVKMGFIELQDKTEGGLGRFVWEGKHSDANGYLVLLRQKYDCDAEWEYRIEFCRQDYSNLTVCWDMDWWEGQQQVEYLAVCVIPYLYGPTK